MNRIDEIATRWSEIMAEEKTLEKEKTRVKEEIVDALKAWGRLAWSGNMGISGDIYTIKAQFYPLRSISKSDAEAFCLQYGKELCEVFSVRLKPKGSSSLADDEKVELDKLIKRVPRDLSIVEIKEVQK